MRKKIVCSTLAMALAASMLFGCASESKTETTAAAGETTAAAETTAEAAKAETNGEKLKVTLLVTGSFGDKAFNDSAQAGMEKLEAELGDKVEVNMVEMGSDKTKFEGSMLDACESDADLIITGLWDMKEITEKVAQEFPEKKFIIFDTDVDYTIGDLSNVYSMSYKQNEGAFLAGRYGIRKRRQRDRFRRCKGYSSCYQRLCSRLHRGRSVRRSGCEGTCFLRWFLC